jgi:hypothetical protein
MMPLRRKRVPLYEFSLCLSRACVGKMIVFSIKRRKRYAFILPAAWTRGHVVPISVPFGRPAQTVRSLSSLSR